MEDVKSLSQRFSDYRPSKTVLFWTCVGCIVATMIVGFGWGGWVTGGAAQARVEEAVQEARAQVAAAVCVEQFMAAPDANTQLTSLKTMGTWSREGFIEDGGWAVIAGEQYEDAAELCAEKLSAMEAPSTQSAAESSSS